MELVVLHSEKAASTSGGNFLHFAFSNELTGSVVIKGLKSSQGFSKGQKLLALPSQWQVNSDAFKDVVFYDDDQFALQDKLCSTKREKWFVLSDGRFATSVDCKKVLQIADALDSDIIAVNVDPQLAAYCEKARVTPLSSLVGFSRWYCDSVSPSAIPKSLPHHLFIKSEVLGHLLPNGRLPLSFEAILSRCNRNSLSINSISVGGQVVDLDTEPGLISFVTGVLDNCKALRDTRKKTVIRGSVLTGENVNIAKNVKILGSSILENDVTVAEGAVINNSVIASGVTVESSEIISNCVLTKERCRQMAMMGSANFESKAVRLSLSKGFDVLEKESVFRTWPLFSYPRLFKRIIDFFGSLTVLIFFAPVFPVIALMIKLTSRGPIFYKSCRQGFYGKPINVLKFRTMIENAESMQEKLRVVNEVDGPQFKMVHDPRISRVGRFLRDTCLDEIPQFINVLLGQMSIVGPRPSPASENSQCPSWRDARLSARPGITGLWQVSRTRRQSRDFQEWVYYDTEYIRNISFKNDLWICFKTAMKILNDLIDQF